MNRSQMNVCPIKRAQFSTRLASSGTGAGDIEHSIKLLKTQSGL